MTKIQNNRRFSVAGFKNNKKYLYNDNQTKIRCLCVLYIYDQYYQAYKF